MSGTATPISSTPAPNAVETYGGYTATTSITLDVGARVVRIQPPAAGTLTVTLPSPLGAISPGEVVVVEPAGTFPGGTAINLAGTFVNGTGVVNTLSVLRAVPLIASFDSWVTARP